MQPFRPISQPNYPLLCFSPIRWTKEVQEPVSPRFALELVTSRRYISTRLARCVDKRSCAYHHSISFSQLTPPVAMSPASKTHISGQPSSPPEARRQNDTRDSAYHSYPPNIDKGKGNEDIAVSNQPVGSSNLSLSTKFSKPLADHGYERYVNEHGSFMPSNSGFYPEAGPSSYSWVCMITTMIPS